MLLLVCLLLLHLVLGDASRARLISFGCEHVDWINDVGVEVGLASFRIGLMLLDVLVQIVHSAQTILASASRSTLALVILMSHIACIGGSSVGKFSSRRALSLPLDGSCRRFSRPKLPRRLRHRIILIKNGLVRLHLIPVSLLESLARARSIDG